MSCSSPITLYRSRAGRDKTTGKWPLKGLRDGYRDMKEVVPCGRCWSCRLERSRQWAMRCVHEAQMHKANSYVTLTYRPDQLIYSVKSCSPVLYPRHLQLFLKRLRKQYGKVRFFACGEYGELNHRPHYHACIFGLDFPDKKVDSVKNGYTYYHSDSLDRIWSHGRCIIGDVTFESAAYVARYIFAKQLGETAVYYSDNDIEPEFIRMSRRPGIGMSWFEKYKTDVFPHDRVVIRGGIKVRPPKYYTEKYGEAYPYSLLWIKSKRKQASMDASSEHTVQKLIIKETIKIAQTKSLQRSKV